MMIEYALRSEKGNRTENQDRAIVSDGHTKDNYAGNISLPAIAAVCDGCGGVKGGSEASSLVIEFLSKTNPSDFWDDTNINDTFNIISQKFTLYGKEHPELSGMATTIACCVIKDRSIKLVHCGDTRIYRFSNGRISKLTLDHSLAQEQIFRCTAEQEKTDSQLGRNRLLKAVNSDYYTSLPEISEILPFGDDNIFMICSDGLWGVITEDEILTILSADKALKEKADILVNYALYVKNSKDNISVVLFSKCKDEAYPSDN